MPYYLDIFSPSTYESFSSSGRDVAGVKLHQKHAAERLRPGDKLICYLTKVSRWIGVLEVLSESFVDETPRFTEIDDPYVVRVRVRPLALLPNMDIKLHIVAPAERREKVFEEIQRPVFSLLDRGPLSEICTFLSYDSVHELVENKYLAHLSDSVLEEYEELVE